MRPNSSTTSGGATYTTEVAVPTVTYTTNVNGQIIVPDFLYTSDQTVTVTNTSGRDVEIRDQFGNVITGNSVVVKANDPNEEQIGSNIFQTNIFTIENEMKYAKVLQKFLVQFGMMDNIMQEIIY